MPLSKTPHIAKADQDYTPDASSFTLRKIGKDGKEESSSVADLLPDHICPHLAHSIIPYILTLSGGGAFPWMEGLDRNAVIAQCPNPTGAVAPRVKAGNGGFDIDVREVRGQCPRGYKVGNSIRWPVDSSVPLMDLNVILSWLVQLHSIAGIARTPDIYSPSGKSTYRIERGEGDGVIAEAPCPSQASFNLSLGHFDHRCRYHKWPRREQYDNSNWIPAGLCPELFHAAYPSCLATLYGGGKAATSEVVCPHEGKVKLGIKLEERRTIGLRRAAMRVLRLFGMNTEVPLHRCFLEVLEADSGCPWRIQSGTKFEFNMGELFELCPAMFHNAYPALAARMRGASFPWPELDKGGGVVQCPDSISNITMIYREEDHA